MNSKLISMNEVAKHNKLEDCWIVIYGKVYDVSKFLPDHPGGTKVILNFAGKDATPGFEPIHPKDILNILPPNCYLGDVDPKTIIKESEQVLESEEKVVPNGTEKQVKKQSKKRKEKPPLSHILNLLDFEAVAKMTMKKESWDYYSSAADDEITLRENHLAFQRIWLKPRVLVNVESIDMSCKLLGTLCTAPIYFTACALGKLGHPDGEVAITRAAYNQGVIQMCPTLASCSLDEMINAKKIDQTLWYQLYVNRDRKISYDIIKRIEKGGIKALFITVDAPQLGRREKDMRNKFVDIPPDEMKKNSHEVKRNQGTARAISSFIDPTLNWNDIKWFKSITSLPIVLKGIQCGEDAILAVKHGVQGIVVSNHGGRQLDFARSGIEALQEVMEALKSIGAEKQIEVFVDGGIRRGTDVFKALALGAKAVGIGRPVLYGLAGYGQDGVERVIELLKDELKATMQLMGTTSISEIKREMIITKNISDHFTPSPKDYLSNDVYIPLSRL